MSNKLFGIRTIDGDVVFIKPEAVNTIVLVEDSDSIEVGINGQTYTLDGNIFFALISAEGNEFGCIELLNMTPAVTDEVPVEDTEYVDENALDEPGKVDVISYPEVSEEVDLAEDLEPEQFDNKEVLHA
jgi:hypothetical protein